METFIHVTLSDSADLSKLEVFDGSILHNSFILPCATDLRAAILAVEYMLSGCVYSLTICN